MSDTSKPPHDPRVQPHQTAGREDEQPEELTSWQEIATFFKRDITTVQRWERLEGLPVRRQRHGGKKDSIILTRKDAIAWQESRMRPPAVPVPDVSPAEPEIISSSPESPAVDPEIGEAVLALPSFIKKHWRLLLTVAIVAAVAAGWLLLKDREGFIKLGEDGFVQTDEFVEGVGPRTALNRYLVVETPRNEQFVQAKLDGDPWQAGARFGETDTEDGTNYRVYVLVTPAVLEKGLIAAGPPPEARAFFTTRVVLKKKR